MPQDYLLLTTPQLPLFQILDKALIPCLVLKLILSSVYYCSLISHSSSSMHLGCNSPSLIIPWGPPFLHPTYQGPVLRNSLPWKDTLEFQGRGPLVCHRNRDSVMIKCAAFYPG